MITLHDILYKCPLVEVRGDLSTQVVDFFFDSRAVVAGSLFVAVRGTASDGHAYISGSVAKGVSAVAQQTGIPVAFGVLTTNTVEQAVDRAGAKHGNKGFDAAMTAIEMANLLRQVRAMKKP